MPRLLIGRIALLVLISGGGAMAQVPDGLLTVAERSGFKATALHSDVVALAEALAKASPLVRLVELGRSGEGRSLPLLIVADPPVASAEAARASGKVVVFLFGNIHAGEVCGKEALPILVREIVAEAHPKLLEHLILLVAPIYNADGNERVARTNRPGQVGPEEGMGIRANAQGLDLNRDYMKLEARETRALVGLLNEWDPHLTIDTHATNGSYHRYILTYEGAKNPAGDRRLIEFSRRALFPEVGRAFEAKSGRKAFHYGNFEDDHARWASFPATPRFGTTYVGLRNRLSILTEAYSHAPFDFRVFATRDYCRAALEFASSHRDAIRALLGSARRDAITAGLDPRGDDHVAIRSRPRALPGKVDVLGFVERAEGGRSVATDEPRDYRCDVEIDFIPALSVPRPFAYLIPPGPGVAAAVEVLRAHGIEVEITKESARREVEVERIDAFSRSRRPFEGHQLVEVIGSATRTEPRDLPAGTALIPTAQALGSLAVTLLDARSDDGLLTWGHFADCLGDRKDYPVLRLGRKP